MAGHANGIGVADSIFRDSHYTIWKFVDSKPNYSQLSKLFTGKQYVPANPLFQ